MEILIIVIIAIFSLFSSLKRGVISKIILCLIAIAIGCLLINLIVAQPLLIILAKICAIFCIILVIANIIKSLFID